jgi:hypothetical protein
MSIINGQFNDFGFKVDADWIVGLNIVMVVV